MKINEIVGRSVRFYRLERGLTQAALAKRCDLSRTSITNIESGFQDPPISTLETLANALAVSIPDLISEIKDVPAKMHGPGKGRKMFARCPECGERVDPHSFMCTHCGADIE